MGSSRERSRLASEERKVEERPVPVLLPLPCETGIGSERLLRLLSSSLAACRSLRIGSETARER